jgi:hypothetical protein
MLYTVGHRESYERYFTEQEQPEKLGRVAGYYPDGSDYKGGSVYLNPQEAKDAAPPDYEVYGLLTSLDNTYEIDGARHLKGNASLVKLTNA